MLEYPTHKVLDLRLQKFSGTQSGLIMNYIVFNGARNNNLGAKIFTGSMPDYTKLTISPDNSMSYHISGYGNFYEEAQVRFMGETIERYSSIMCHLYLKNLEVSGTATELMSNYKKVLPAQYINNFTLEQRKKLNKYNNNFCLKNYNEDMKTDWVIANSLTEENEKVLIPKGMFCVGYIPHNVYMPAFTTGCACHETIFKATINALVEYFQIDAFMVNWYTDLPRSALDTQTLPKSLKDAIRLAMGNYFNKYDILILDYSKQCLGGIPVIGVFIIAKDKTQYPAISFGVQSGPDPENVIYRGFLEAFAVFQMNMHVPFTNNFVWQTAKNKDNPFFDLDTNVQYYGFPQNRNKNLDFIKSTISNKVSYSEFCAPFKKVSRMSSDEFLRYLIRKVKKVSKYACYMDITPPNLESDSRFHVMRVFIPEMLTMSFPGFPYKNHQRYKISGGNICEFPHPLP